MQLTKKDKRIIAGFIVLAIVGFFGTIAIFFNDKEEKSAEPDDQVEQVEEDVEDSMIIDHINAPTNPELVNNNEVSFEDDTKLEMPEDEVDYYISETRALVLEGDFEGARSLLEPVVTRYNMKGEKGHILSNLYADMNLLLTQAEMEDDEERALVAMGVTDPETMALSFPHLPTEVFIHTVYDGNSMNVSRRGEVIKTGKEVYHPAIIEGEDSLNAYLLENPYTLLYLERQADIADVDGVYEVPVRIQGVDTTAYIVQKMNKSLSLLGYYVDNPSEFGSRFQSVDWHKAQRQKLQDAVYTNWGEKTGGSTIDSPGQEEQGGEEFNEREIDELEEE